MGYLSEKAAYLRGLADGLELKNDTKEGKVLSAIIELLDEMALEIDDVILAQDDLQEQLDCVDTALSELEDDVYSLDEEDDELDLNDLGDFVSYDDDEFDEDFDDEDFEDMEEEYSLECPKCGDMIYVDVSLLDDNDVIVCPNCKERIELEFDCDCPDCEDEE